MKIQKTLYSFCFLSFLSAFIANFTACGNNSSNGSTTATAPPTAPAAPVLTACAAGQVPTQFGCLATINCVGAQAGYGYYPTTNICYPPSSVPGVGVNGFSQTGRWGAGIVGINHDALEQLLTDWGLCNRYNFNWGAEKCNRYSSAAYIIVMYSGGSSAYVQVSAGVSNPDYLYLMDYAAGGAYNRGYGNGLLSVNTSLQIASNGAAGMQLTTGFNPMYFSNTAQGLVITDANENFNNNTMNLTITYGGQTLGVANATHY